LERRRAGLWPDRPQSKVPKLLLRQNLIVAVAKAFW
jgi:hypothetical protein